MHQALPMIRTRSRRKKACLDSYLDRVAAEIDVEDREIELGFRRKDGTFRDVPRFRNIP